MPPTFCQARHPSLSCLLLSPPVSPPSHSSKLECTEAVLHQARLTGICQPGASKTNTFNMQTGLTMLQALCWATASSSMQHSGMSVPQGSNLILHPGLPAVAKNRTGMAAVTRKGMALHPHRPPLEGSALHLLWNPPSQHHSGQLPALVQLLWQGLWPQCMPLLCSVHSCSGWHVKCS